VAQSREMKMSRLDWSEKLLNETALLTAQTAKNLEKQAKELREHSKQWRQQLKQIRDEHNRDMKEIRVLLKQIPRRRKRSNCPEVVETPEARAIVCRPRREVPKTQGGRPRPSGKKEK